MRPAEMALLVANYAYDESHSQGSVEATYTHRAPGIGEIVDRHCDDPEQQWEDGKPGEDTHAATLSLRDSAACVFNCAFTGAGNDPQRPH